MREPKRRPPFSLSTSQWVMLELLLLANVLLLAVLIIIALSEGWGAAASSKFSHKSAQLAVAAADDPINAPLFKATFPPTSTGESPTRPNAPTPTITLTATVVRSPSNTPTSARTHAYVAPTLTPTPALPPEARVVNIVGRSQSLPLSCEARSAADWAAYFGFEIDELEFFARLPLTDNPDTGFVGDVNGEWGHIPPDAYGVHAEPVAALLREYGVNAEAMRGLALHDLRAEIAAGRPVIVWVVGHVTTASEPVLYTASDGTATVVAPYEHTVIVTGYTRDRVRILDGDKIYSRPVETFLASWSVLGNMAIVGTLRVSSPVLNRQRGGRPPR